jgi:hypothetical protein
MPKVSIELSDYASDVLGRDTAAAMDMAARILASEVRDLEDAFSEQEWRALAGVFADTPFPPERDPGNRMVFEIEDCAAVRDLAADFNVGVADLLTKVKGLTASQQWAVLTTVQFAAVHAPTRLDSEMWWTLAYRRAQGEATAAASKKRPRPRQAKSPDIAHARHTMTKGAEALADQTPSEGVPA